MQTAEIKLSDQQGTLIEFLPMLEEQLNDDYSKIPLGGSGNIGRTNKLSEPT